MRRLIALLLFATACGLAANPDSTGQEPKQPDPKKPQPKFAPPKTMKPDEATLKQIAEKTEQLRKAVDALKAKKIPDDVFVEVAIYLKAAENIVRFEEWYAAASGKWALTTLDEGLERAKVAEGGKAPWRDIPGKWCVRAYRSTVDDSIQPYAVLLPHTFKKNGGKTWRLDVVLHGRDGSLTEAKFIDSHNHTKSAPKDLDSVQLEVYGRGNNAYRWAGETDVRDATGELISSTNRDSPDNAKPLSFERVVLRGFSMGGAGTWHMGLHNPSVFCVIGPGAGFTTTHGYVGGLPKELPDYQEKCLRIYDAVGYAENAFNVPIVAYSGEKDAQKAAADNIETALKAFKEPFKFTHLIAPGLEHQMPKEWQDKAEAEYKKYSAKGRDTNPDRVRFVTYTPRYGRCNWVTIWSLDETYTKAVIDATYADKSFTVKTTNIRRFDVTQHRSAAGAKEVLIDGTKVTCSPDAENTLFEKRDGKWNAMKMQDFRAEKGTPYKQAHYQGPIDDAFMAAFKVVKPTAPGYSPAIDKHATAAIDQFAGLWDRYFRGTLPTLTPEQDIPEQFRPNLVLFGDPKSNPLIAKVIDKLPITWTPTKLVVNGVEYDAKTHVPVLIYPNPLDTNNASYVVINSGHTFKEADLKGTNALLYPRLGDWAVIKPTPTDKDPAAYEVVAAGLFDEKWQFPKAGK